MRLYRSGLKNIMDWTVQRELFISEGFALRAEFDANKHVSDPYMVEKLVSAGEERLAYHAHPDPYTIPTAPGGSKYMRHPGNGLGPAAEIIGIPSYFK